MYRNQYDTNVTTFSPAGRQFQIEYACEAVRQGSASAGVVANDYVVQAALRRGEDELSGKMKKIHIIDDNVGVTISGQTPDGYSACKFLRNECLHYKWLYNTQQPINRLVGLLSDKNQEYTQTEKKRPVGVGLLIAGYDSKGPHLYETSPNATFQEWRAQAIGSRYQSCKTYFEKHIDEIEACTSLDDIILHAVRAIKDTSQDPLTKDIVSIGYVGRDTKFTILEDDQVERYVYIIFIDFYIFLFSSLLYIYYLTGLWILFFLRVQMLSKNFTFR